MEQIAAWLTALAFTLAAGLEPGLTLLALAALGRTQVWSLGAEFTFLTRDQALAVLVVVTVLELGHLVRLPVSLGPLQIPAAVAGGALAAAVLASLGVSSASLQPAVGAAAVGALVAGLVATGRSVLLNVLGRANPLTRWVSVDLCRPILGASLLTSLLLLLTGIVAPALVPVIVGGLALLAFVGMRLALGGLRAFYAWIRTLLGLDEHDGHDLSGDSDPLSPGSGPFDSSLDAELARVEAQARDVG